MEAPGTARQVTHTAIPAKPGTYTIEFASVLAGDIYYAVSGGLATDLLEVPSVLPGPAAFPAVAKADERAATGPGAAILAGLAMLAVLRRR